jgi:arginyl-tRNA synthetase
MDIRMTIREALSRALGELSLSLEGNIPLEHPADFAHGDYASGIALKLTKAAGMPPRVLAEKIVVSLGAIEGVAKIDIAGPGFINFHLAPEAIARCLEEARTEDMWGANTALAGQKIMVEYTDPNPFKEFHIGHLVPNTLGESLSRLLQFSGADVWRVNYQGDVGIHVAKSLFIMLEKGIIDPTIEDLSIAYPEGSRRYEEDAEAKVAIDALNKKIYERNDERINDLYDKGRSLSLEYFEKMYKILGTKFDHYFFESKTGPVGAEVVRAHPEVFPESEGARIFPGEQYGLHTRVFLNKMGLPTYEAKEIGLAKLKEEAWDFDLTITITGNEQHEYFRVAMKAMELALPELRGKLSFKTNGMLRFAEGKMSSRTGNIIRGEDLINDLRATARERASESRADDHEQLAQEVAVAAIKYQILKQGFGKDIIFDRERALSLEGDSGPYLQYAYARTSAVVAKAKEAGVVAKAEPQVSDLARLVQRFPEIVEYANALREPHILATYLIALASGFNSWYGQEQILDGTSAQTHKVALTDAVRKTLKNGLWILGIPAPEKM